MTQGGFKIAAAAGLIAAGALVAPMAGAMMMAAQVAAPSPALVAADAGDSDVSIVLARRICERLKVLAPDSDAIRFEAEMVYALSQSGDDVSIQVAALKRVPKLCPMPGNMQIALANAGTSINNGGTAGTAATAASLGQGGFDSGSAFSSPAVNLGGGSVNYSR